MTNVSEQKENPSKKKMGKQSKKIVEECEKNTDKKKKNKRRILQFEVIYTCPDCDAPQKYINPVDEIIKKINEKNKTRTIIY